MNWNCGQSGFLYSQSGKFSRSLPEVYETENANIVSRYDKCLSNLDVGLLLEIINAIKLG